MLIRVSHVIAALGVCALGACSRGGAKKTDSVAFIDSAARSAAGAVVPPTPAPTPTAVVLTDANIAAVLDEVNAADSATGHLAATKGTSSAVKEFGHTMVRDHHALRKAGHDLVMKLHLTPAPPANDTLPSAAQRTLANLNAMAKGPEWDKAYIDGEISVHQAVLAMLQTAQGSAQDTMLKALIIKATPTVEGHLKKAQDIAGKLNMSAPMSSPTGDSMKKKY